MQIFKIGELSFDRIDAVRNFLLASGDLDQIVSIWSRTASGKIYFELSGEKLMNNIFKEADVVWEFEQHRRNFDVVFGESLRENMKNIPISFCEANAENYEGLFSAVLNDHQRIPNRFFDDA